MDGFVGTLRLGWNALLLKTEAYEKMRTDPNPVVKGLLLIVIVGVAIALLGFVGNLLEWATTPDLNEIMDTVFSYMKQMPWWEMAARDPDFERIFDQIWNTNWSFVKAFSPSPVGAAVDIVLTPVGLIVRWLIYGLLAYLFARWLGGTADLSETLGVLALAVAPQALNALTFFPYVTVGSVIGIWGILCAYVGLKTAHKLPWHRAFWATLLPFILAFGVIVLAGCLGSTIFAAIVKGG
jgi:hypothetical protein